MMPAMRAAPSTSPFLALPLCTSLSVCDRMCTRPSATATRSVAGLAETSTMRASPRAPRWVSFPEPRVTALFDVGERRTRRKERPRRGRHVVLTHQAFADQECRDAGFGEASNILRREDAALADDDAIARHQAREPLGGGQRGLEGFQIAIVDADQPRSEAQRAFDFLGIVNLEI